MSEPSGGRGGGVGPFLFGIAIGAALGYLFAPAPGAESRRKLAGRWRDLKEFAGEEADELKALVAETVGEEGGDEEDGERDEGDAREELERRVAAARRRRRERRHPSARGDHDSGGGSGGGSAEEDEPVA